MYRENLQWALVLVITLGITVSMFLFQTQDGLLALIPGFSEGKLKRFEGGSYLSPKPLFEIDSKYIARRREMQAGCRKLSASYPGFSASQSYPISGIPLVMDRRHRLMYCPLAKTATTFWKRVMQLSSGVKSGNNIFNITGHAHDNSLEYLHLNNGIYKGNLITYNKFIFVREPYSRLLAAYVDKFFASHSPFWRTGIKIIERYRKNPSKKSLQCGHDVLFSEFIKHVIVTVSSPERCNIHWRPMYLRCRPCMVNFEIIGKLETMSDDLDYLFETFHLNDSVKFDDMPQESERDIVQRNTRAMLKTIDAECMNITEALHRLLREQQVRGYLSKDINIPDTMLRGSLLDSPAVLQFMKKAMADSGDRSVRKGNRREAFLEAYSSISMEDRLTLKDLFYPDFILSGYEPMPSELFGEGTKKPERFYFV